MKDSCFFPGLLVILLLTSCQKEINWKNDVKFCGVSAITVRNSSGIVIEKYEYGYDTALRRPNVLRYQNLKSGISQVIIPRYSNDTIYYANDVFAITDRSHRIKTLTTKDATTGNQLIYYYTYNIFGYLDQRIIDDGVNEAVHTNFSYDKGVLTGFRQDFQGYPLALSAVVSYQDSTHLSGYYEYSLVELFPELVLYLPSFQLGKMSAYAIQQVDKTVNNSNLPQMRLTNIYSNYSVNAEGWPEGFQTEMIVSGVPRSSSKYAIDYNCF